MKFELNRAGYLERSRKTENGKGNRRRRTGLSVESLEGRALLSTATTTYPIPFEGGFAVSHMVAAPDGSVWLSEAGSIDLLDGSHPQVSSIIVRISPTGQVSTFPLPKGIGVEAIAPGPDGSLWFIKQTYDTVGTGLPILYSPAASTVVGALESPGIPPSPSTISQPGPTALDNTLAKITSNGVISVVNTSLGNIGANADVYLANGPDGNLYAVGLGEVLKITPAGGVTAMDPGLNSADHFNSPVFDANGNLWVGNGRGDTYTPQIDRITPDGTITRFGISAPFGFPNNLVNGPDGDIWFRDSDVATHIGKISMSGTITTYAVPDHLSISGIATSPTNHDIWFASSAYPAAALNNPLQLGQISTDGTFTVDPALSSTITNGGAIAFGPGGRLFVAEATQIPTASLSIAALDFAPLTVTGVARAYSYRQHGSQVILAFSGALDADSATAVGNYHLESYRLTRRGVVDLGSVAIASANYDATLGRVTLQVGRLLNPRLYYVVTANAKGVNGLTGAEGQYLSGAKAGGSGTNFVTVLGPGLKFQAAAFYRR